MNHFFVPAIHRLFFVYLACIKILLISFQENAEHREFMGKAGHRQALFGEKDNIRMTFIGEVS